MPADDDHLGYGPTELTHWSHSQRAAMFGSSATPCRTSMITLNIDYWFTAQDYWLAHHVMGTEVLAQAIESGNRPGDPFALEANFRKSRLINIHLERVQRLRPPEVEADNGKKWTIFREDKWEDSFKTAMMELRAHNKEHSAQQGETEWYNHVW
ncbi:hypothetical protein C8R44DRAFT_729695 [Mycena epipterygia]|nr:hypothetical protein C8R44DRAFT_729695 [Mycena epipterygia]